MHRMTSILCYVIIYEQVTNKSHYLFTAILHMMTSILCNVIIYEKVTNKCAKNIQYLKKRVYQKMVYWLDHFGSKPSFVETIS